MHGQPSVSRPPLSTVLETVAEYVELCMCPPAPATNEVEIDCLENPNEVDEEEIEMEKNCDIPMTVYAVPPTTNWTGIS